MPLLMALISPSEWPVPMLSIASLAFLAPIGAKAGGANVLRAMIRVGFWGAMAMAITAGIGAAFGTAV